LKYLNIGCGNRFCKEWINIDFNPASNCVDSVNLLNGLPFNNNTFDLVYHSHLLEHFSKKDGEFIIQECYRVLKTNGIIRVVVPDLEQWAKTYLDLLEDSNRNSEQFIHNHEWIVMELIDQFVREKSGGVMAEYLSKDFISNEEFVKSRIGEELIIENRKGDSTAHHLSNKISYSKNILTKIKKIYASLKNNYALSDLFLRFLFKNNYENLLIARFRNKGEIHKWMYDKYSLTRLLSSKGFKDILFRLPIESYMNNWIDWNLDTNPDGAVYRPNSLYLEAVKY
jgi:predicted SAM-dependent methyltransferase